MSVQAIAIGIPDQHQQVDDGDQEEVLDSHSVALVGRTVGSDVEYGDGATEVLQAIDLRPARVPQLQLVVPRVAVEEVKPEETSDSRNQQDPEGVIAQRTNIEEGNDAERNQDT